MVSFKSVYLCLLVKATLIHPCTFIYVLRVDYSITCYLVAAAGNIQFVKRELLAMKYLKIPLFFFAPGDLLQMWRRLPWCRYATPRSRWHVWLALH